MKMKAGAVRAKPPANLNGRGDTLSDWTTCAGSVALWRVRISAPKTSFQESTKLKSAAAARPGTLSGSTTRSTAPTRLTPRIIAASSSSPETRTKTLAESRTVNGSDMAVCRNATPHAPRGAEAPPFDEGDRQRDGEHQRGEHPNREQEELREIAALEGVAGNGVAGRAPQQQREDDRDQTHEQASLQGGQYAVRR